MHQHIYSFNDKLNIKYSELKKKINFNILTHYTYIILYTGNIIDNNDNIILIHKFINVYIYIYIYIIISIIYL